MSDARSTKHLEMLQAAITRMAGHSFLAKGWSVTVAVAVLGFAAKDKSPQLLGVGVLAVALFWLIDAYYLALETGFRSLFEAAVKAFQEQKDETFAMAPPISLGVILRALLRPAAAVVHASLLAGLALAGELL